MKALLHDVALFVKGIPEINHCYEIITRLGVE